MDDKNNDAVKSIISLKRLIVGGAAMLPAAIRNHHMVSAGKSVNSPLVR